MTDMRAGDAVENPAAGSVAEALAEAARCDNRDFAVRRLSERPLPFSPRTDSTGGERDGRASARSGRNHKKGGGSLMRPTASLGARGRSGRAPQEFGRLARARPKARVLTYDQPDSVREREMRIGMAL